ncbi:Yip1 family protein [Celerinatantimonas sp. MCCC 1A17872]|uniref:Yip1 family protein n=1 Tax=Celerinatantimonas sp. MCCC 1A17872 TaxID=3177514 RepID=UPI0038C543ED
MEPNQPIRNPWTSIWTRPGDTIEQIVKTNPKNSVIVLAAVSGFSEFLYQLSELNVGGHYNGAQIAIFSLIAGSILGAVMLYILAGLLRWSGKWLGGNASPEHLRAAVSWANVPTIWALLLWIPRIALLGHDAFLPAAIVVKQTPNLVGTLWVLQMIQLVIGIWALIIFSKCVGRVQHFSAMKGFLNIVLSLIILMLCVTVLFSIVSMFVPSLASMSSPVSGM